MKGKLLLVTLVSLSLMIGCKAHGSNISAEPNPRDQYEQDDIPVTYLFSNEDMIEEESSYYDAVIEFNRIYPGLMKFKDIVTVDDVSLVEFYRVEVFPTLLVVFDTEEILRIEGFKDSKEIFVLLENCIAEKKEKEDI